MDPGERRNQRAFLKKHTSVDWRDYRPRFLKTIADKKRRSRRDTQTTAADADAADADAADADAADADAADAVQSRTVLRDVAEDELEQVELIMEDISDEISNLEVI